MASGAPDVTRTLIERHAFHIQRIMDSIAEHGIVALQNVRKDVQPTFILGGEETQKNVCVNYLDLSAHRPDSNVVAAAIHEAVWEEYTGIFGISLERAWPLDMHAQPLLVAKEIISRVSSNIVFVLKPPTQKGRAIKIRAIQPVRQEEFVTTKCYHHNDLANIDGISTDVAREKCLDTLQKTDISVLAEIKTKHPFNPAEILHVLIPEGLINLLPERFKAVFKDKIIPVPYTIGKINKLPHTVTVLHGETIPPNTLQTRVPNYEEVLLTRIVPQHKEFSIHAVRLPTEFDYSLRYIESLQEKEKLLAEAQANLILASRGESRSGWVILHKSKMIDITNVAAKTGIKISKRLDPSAFSKQIKAAKGVQQMGRHYALPAGAVAGLTALPGVTVLVVNYALIGTDQLVVPTVITFNYHPSQKNIVNDTRALAAAGDELIKQQHLKQQHEQRAIAELRKKQENAVIIQTAYRRFITRKNYLAYKAGKSEVDELELGVTALEQQLIAIKARLTASKGKVVKHAIKLNLS